MPKGVRLTEGKLCLMHQKKAIFNRRPGRTAMAGGVGGFMLQRPIV